MRSVPSFTVAFHHLLQTPTRGAGPAGREECVRGDAHFSERHASSREMFAIKACVNTAIL